VEVGLIRPRTLVCLGVTAASAVLGRRVTISSTRGQALLSPAGIRTFVTIHPSAILRMADEASRRAELLRFVEELRTAAQEVGCRGMA
jgi:uracil-DNA glycosylase family 4